MLISEETNRQIKNIKINILETAAIMNPGHITSSLSSVEILYAVYKDSNISLSNLNDINRDKVIISKEHCRLAQICVLAELGLLDKSLLQTFCCDDGFLGHDIYNLVGSEKIMAVDVASGSLGHGAGVGAGLALGNKDRKVYCICGDGELQEGALWEAFLFVAQHNLLNFTLIIDRNYMQIDNYTKNIIDTATDLEKKLSAFGFEAYLCNGHDVSQLAELLSKKTSKPKCIIADTVKGHGLEYLQNDRSFAMFHHSSLTKEEFKKALETIKNE